jgi:enolase
MEKLHARQILDSRGNPTIEVDCILDDGSLGRAAVPSGASTGSHEAVELRDNDPKLYQGKSVLKAVQNVHTVIRKEMQGKELPAQTKLDQTLRSLDGSENLSKLGANAVLAVSMAAARARAESEKKPLFLSLAAQFGVSDASLLPVPLLNVLNGGKHADSGLSFQECMLVPIDFSSFSDALRAAAETFHVLKTMLTEARHVIAVGDEGGFAPRLTSNREALEILVRAIKRAGYEGRMRIAIDAAATEFFERESSKYRIDSGSSLTSEELMHYYKGFAHDFPIVSIEDSHGEDDWEGFVLMTKELGKTVQLVGDDLLVTNVKRMERAIKENAVNAVLVKVNQIGTVSDAVDAILLAQKNGWHSVVSHRSGETEDTFIAHLAVALRAGQIKTGAPCRGERTAKYNELLRIEESLGTKAEYRNPFAT